MTLLLLQSVPTTETPAVLALCLAMTLALLWYVFSVPQEVTEAPEKTRLMYLRERKDVVYENLRDLNFEFKAGKFPEADYRQMRASLEDEAASLLAEIQRLESSSLNTPTLRFAQDGAPTVAPTVIDRLESFPVARFPSPEKPSSAEDTEGAEEDKQKGRQR